MNISTGYAKGSGFAVKANGVALAAKNGVYTISNIKADQTVTVSGVVAGSSGGSTNTLPAAPSITSSLLPSATMGVAYKEQLTATGGTPITWSYTGSLPEGVTLSSSGLLSGTPKAEGSFRFTLKASNSAGSTNRQMTLVVTGAEYTVSKGANANWAQGSQDGLTFQGSGDKEFTVRVDGSAVPEADMTFSADKTEVTLSSGYLGTLSTGSHTLTLIYPDGNAKTKFNIKAQDRTVPPAVTSQPQNSEAKEGDSVTFAVTASGTTPLLCQWQVDKNDGAGWTNISGAASASYTVQKVTPEQNGWKYRCVITNAAGSAESNAATLTVKEELGPVAPEDSEEPAKKSNTGKIILFSVLGLAAAGIGGGLYMYSRKRRYIE